MSDSSASSDSDSDREVVRRIQRGRRKERVERDASGDARRDLDRRKRANRARRQHRQRAEESTSEESGSASESADNDSDTERRRILKKRQPAAREAELRSKTEAEKRKEKLRRLREQREAQRRGGNGGTGQGSGRNQGNAGDLALDIDEEDLENGEILTLEQRAEFFKMHGPVGGVDDNLPLLSVNDFGLSVESLVRSVGAGASTLGRKGSGQSARSRSTKKGALGKAWVYVENVANGKFKRVPMSRLGYTRLAESEETAKQDGMQGSRHNGPNLMNHRTHQITAFVSGVFQFAQGLLAGLSLLHLFLVQSITTFGTFQMVYQPLANESRRLYFVLASLGFSSAVDTYLRESENRDLWMTLSLVQKIRIVLLGVLYGTTLGLSLAMMPTDTKIAIQPSDVTAESLSVWGIFEYIR